MNTLELPYDLHITGTGTRSSSEAMPKMKNMMDESVTCEGMGEVEMVSWFWLILVDMMIKISVR